MKKIFSGLDTGICTVLPENCYPLEGVAIIKDDKDNIVTIGEFCLNRGYEELQLKTNIHQVYFTMKENDNGNLYLNPSDFLKNNYKYELIAQTRLSYQGVTVTNVQINGNGKFSGDYEVSIKDINDNGVIKVKFYPLYKDGHLCDLRVW